ncbi:MAG TPA: hypothetical protein VF741_04435, partial [Candidatus Aquilonibacter sp.]
ARTLIRDQFPTFPEELLAQRFALLTYEETLRFLEVFRPDNRDVEREYGVHIPFQNESDVAPKSDPLWDKARLERALFDELLADWMRLAR